MTGEPPVPTWSGRAARAFHVLLGTVTAISAGSAFVAALAGDGDDRIAGMVFVPLVLLIAGGIWGTFGSVHLELHPDQVVVRYGRSPFRSRYRLVEVQDVDVDHVRFWQYGGFGYRGSRRLLKRAAIMVRSGEAVRLHLDDGSTVSITVDGAQQATTAILHARGG